MGAPQSVPMGQTISDFQFRRTTVTITRGDLAAAVADALVCSDDNYLTMGGGASLALLKAGGQQIREDARKHAALQLGDVVAMTAGALQARYILFVIVVDFDRGVYAGEAQLREALLRCLRLADALSVRSLAFPALATGFAGMAPAVAAEVMVRALADYLSGETGLTRVTLVEYADQPTPGPFYTRAVEVAAELAQVRRFYDILDELQTMALAGSLQENLEALKREIDALKDGLRSIQERAAALHRLDQPSPAAEQAALAAAPKLPGTEDVDLAALRRTLTDALSEDELKTVCFDLSVNADDLGTAVRAGMVRELINTLIRYKRLDRLIEWVRKNRPDIALG
ncbi:MAG: macro domain-containing protein [Anaerolineae bacterium]